MPRLPELPSIIGASLGTIGIIVVYDRIPNIQATLCDRNRMVSDATRLVNQGLLSFNEAANHVLLRCQSTLSSSEAQIGLVAGALAGAFVLAVESFKQPENKPEPEWWKSIQEWHPWTKNIVPTFKALRTASAVAAPLLFIHFIQATDYIINGQPTAGEILVNLAGAGTFVLGAGTIFKRGYEAYKMNSRRIKSGVNTVREMVTEATDDVRAELERRQRRDGERSRILALVEEARENGRLPDDGKDRAKVLAMLQEANETPLSGMMGTYTEYRGREVAKILAAMNANADNIEDEIRTRASNRKPLPKS